MLGREDLIFPFLYVNVDRLDIAKPVAVFDPIVLDILDSRQRVDFRALRTRSPDTDTSRPNL